MKVFWGAHSIAKASPTLTDVRGIKLAQPRPAILHLVLLPGLAASFQAIDTNRPMAPWRFISVPINDRQLENTLRISSSWSPHHFDAGCVPEAKHSSPQIHSSTSPPSTWTL
jgi:hypothetical protein